MRLDLAVGVVLNGGRMQVGPPLDADRVVGVIEWMSWLAQFPVREITSQNRTMCKRYFPIGNFVRVLLPH